MIDLFYKGGPLMYPLLVGSLLMIVVIIERGFHFIGTGVNRRFVDLVRQYLRIGEYEKILDLTERYNGPVSTIVREAICQKDKPKEVIENELSITGDQVLQRLSRNLHLLELIGKIAPMIGLLGTVMGMVEAFQKVASVKSLVDPSLLASGIWEALITTVAGLFIGIPALVFHHLYLNKVKSVAFSMKHYGEEVVDLIGEKN
jgi:biopolymer transport protein ExbB